MFYQNFFFCVLFLAFGLTAAIPIPSNDGRPVDPCHICKFAVGRAENHFANGTMTDEKRLRRELEHECIKLAQTEGDEAASVCIQIISANLDQIFNEIKSGFKANQICIDIHQCQSSTGGTNSPWNYTVMPTQISNSQYPWNFTIYPTGLSGNTTGSQAWNNTVFPSQGGTNQPWNFTIYPTGWSSNTIGSQPQWNSTMLPGSNQPWNFTIYPTGSSGNTTGGNQSQQPQWNMTMLPLSLGSDFNKNLRSAIMTEFLRRFEAAQ